MLGGVAGPADRLVIDVLELPLGDVGVVPLELLLGAQLDAEIRELALAPLTVLAGPVFAAVDRALRPAPDILAEAPVDLVFRGYALGHRLSQIVRVERLLCPPRMGTGRQAEMGSAQSTAGRVKCHAGPKGPA